MIVVLLTQNILFYFIFNDSYNVSDAIMGYDICFFKRNFQYEDVAIYNFIYIKSLSGYKPNF